MSLSVEGALEDRSRYQSNSVLPKRCKQKSTEPIWLRHKCVAMQSQRNCTDAKNQCRDAGITGGFMFPQSESLNTAFDSVVHSIGWASEPACKVPMK